MILTFVSVKVNLSVSLKFLVFANLELVSCEVYFPEKKNSEKLILNQLKSLFFVFRKNVAHEKCSTYYVNHTWHV